MRKKTVEEIREANRARQARWRARNGPMNRLRAKNGYWEARGGRPDNAIKHQELSYADMAMVEGDEGTVKNHYAAVEARGKKQAEAKAPAWEGDGGREGTISGEPVSDWIARKMADRKKGGQVKRGVEVEM